MTEDADQRRKRSWDYPSVSQIFFFDEETGDEIQTITGDSLQLPEVGEEIRISHIQTSGKASNEEPDEFETVQEGKYKVESIDKEYTFLEYEIEDEDDESDEGEMSLLLCYIALEELGDETDEEN